MSDIGFDGIYAALFGSAFVALGLSWGLVALVVVRVRSGNDFDRRLRAAIVGPTLMTVVGVVLVVPVQLDAPLSVRRGLDELAVGAALLVPILSIVLTVRAVRRV